MARWKGILMMTTDVRWDRAGARCAGKADRAQRGVYAALVNEQLTGQKITSDGMLICPLTGEPFHISNGEVDKITPSLGYVPGNVCMVSKVGNQGRSVLQQHGNDLPGLLRYKDAVTIASCRVPLPRKVDASKAWEAMGRSAHHVAVLAGPYGKA